jgi:hypothetical protein
LLNGFSCPISAPADLNQRNHPATQEGAATSYNEGRKDFPIHILAAMKTKHLLQLPVLFALLFHSAGTSQPVLADANADTTAQLQAQPSVSITVLPMRLSLNEAATATVSLNNVPAEGYTSAEFSCTYPVDLVQVSNIVVSGLFGPDPAIAIYDQQDGNFVVGIAGTQGNKANASSTAFTFQVKGLGTGQVTLDCMARVSDGSNILTAIGSDTIELTVAEATATPTLAPTACDRAEFIADINVPPGTFMTPSQQFMKTWRLKNVGSCAWTTSYRLAFFSGEQMGAVSSAQFPREVAPGQMVDLAINMTAPSMPGSYRGYWIFQNDTGQLFGIGSQGSQPWFVDIVVLNATPTPSATATLSPTPTYTPGGPTLPPPSNAAFDFVAQVCTATWSNMEGQLPCPGTDGDPNGFVLKINNPTLETGVAYSHPGLVTFPQNIQNGYIQGFYPPFHVQPGDRFRSVIGCEGGARDCYVAFRLDYQVGSDPSRTFWGPFRERYEGQPFSVDIDLSPLAGKDVRFTLTVLSDGTAIGDRALWAGPIIYRPNPALTSTPSPTPGSDWLTFTNTHYGFTFQYPPPGPAIANNNTFAHIELPFAQGTNLVDKSISVSALENINTCMGGLPLPQSSMNVTINGIPFVKQTGQDSGAGHLFRWTSYATSGNNVCVSLTFMLESINPNTLPTTSYDEAAESAIFEQIVATYRWLEIPPTNTPMLTPTATHSPTPTGTITPTSGTISGRVLAGRPVTLDLFDANHSSVGSVLANLDGTFSLSAPAGMYNLLASAPGFLSAMGPVTVTADGIVTMPTITLLAGDIDNNNTIDQFDALTIGMNYNSQYPEAADLNHDGIINVLDLEVLASNYRKTGPVPWEN